MIDSLLDAAQSLTSLMAEEDHALSTRGRCVDHAETVAAKRRVAAMLEAEIARLNRIDTNWMARLEEDDQTTLREAMAALSQAALANYQVLERHLSLSSEMMDAVTAEAKRLTGNRGCSYQINGALVQRDGSSPISVNTRL